MIRVVIVEDEMLVRLGMKTILEQSAHPIRVSGTFATAQEALDWFSAHTADVLVTDIRLPGMSGLELVAALGPEHRDMGKLVLSCYDNFEYARSAYELGVDKYVLKHELQEDELPDLIRRVHNAAAALPERREPAAGAPPEGGALYLLAGAALLRGAAADGYGDVDLDMLVQLLAEISGPHSLRRVGPHSGERLYVLLGFSPGMDEAALRAEMELFFATACRRLGNFVSGDLFLAVSRPFEAVEQIPEAEKALNRAMDAAFYCDAPQMVWAAGLPPFRPACPPLDWPADSLLREGAGEAFSAYLAEYFAACRRANAQPDAVRVQAAAFLHQLDAALRKNYGTSLEEVCAGELPANYIGIQRIVGGRRLAHWLEGVAGQVGAYGEEERKKQNRMAGILEYLQQNYRQNITLEHLAAAFHISPAYLSSQFSSKTGQTFTRYLGDLRIGKARQLLEESDLSIEQIALETGFNNSNYFFRLFKRTTGQTAGEYRRQKRKETKT